MHDQLCVRGPRCEDAQAGIDPESGEPARIGAVTSNGCPLCDTCVRFVRYALGSFPLDVAELTVLMAPSAAIHYRDPDLPDQPRVKLHAPLPFNGAAEAMRARLVNEVTSWAEVVAVETGGEWDTDWAHMTRLGFRVQFAARLLDDHLLYLLALPTARRRIYSTGLDRANGWDVDEATVHGGDVWADRDGANAAITFLRIHEQVRAFAGRIPSDRLAMPCPRCHQRNLHREHHKSLTDPRTGEESQGRVVCRTCWQQWTDGGYSELVAATARAFGVAI